MSNTINEGSEVFKKYKKLFKKKLLVVRCNNFFNQCVKNIHNIINATTLTLDDVITEEYTHGNSAISIEKQKNTFIERNTTYLKDDKYTFTQSFMKSLQQFLLEYLQEAEVETNTTKTLLHETRESMYRDVLEYSNDEGTFLQPLETFNDTSFILNIFYNNDVNFIFTNTRKVESHKEIQNSTIFTMQAKIIGKTDDINFPSKYKVLCTKKENNEECGNIVYFSEAHTHSTIYCSDSNHSTMSHPMKDVANAPVVNMYTLYGYVIELDGETEMIYSTSKINVPQFKGNFIKYTKKDTTLLILLGIQENEVQEINEPILTTSTQSLFLDDIFQDIKKYYKKYHNITITNNNKIIALYYIKQLLDTMIFNFQTLSLFLGKSASGKSFFNIILTPLFTTNYATLYSRDVTRNRLIGGQSGMKSFNNSSMFVGGYVESCDFVVLEEAGYSLDIFDDPRYTSSNPLKMIKGYESGFINPGIQGSRNVNCNASLCFLGNLEDIREIKEYLKKVRNEYNKLSGLNNYKYSYPLFWPLQKYEELFNIELAKAHYKIRNESEYGNFKHHITTLKEAEFARFTYFIVIEDAEDREKRVYFQPTKNISKYIHTQSFMCELRDIFNKDVIDTIPTTFMSSVEEYFNTRFLKVFPSLSRNTHLLSSLLQSVYYFIVLQKIYYKEEWELSEKNKNIIEYFYKYNYNTLDENESSMKKHCYMNHNFLTGNKDEIKDEIYNKELSEEEEKVFNKNMEIVLDEDFEEN